MWRTALPNARWFIKWLYKTSVFQIYLNFDVCGESGRSKAMAESWFSLNGDRGTSTVLEGRWGNRTTTEGNGRRWDRQGSRQGEGAERSERGVFWIWNSKFAPLEGCSRGAQIIFAPNCIRFESSSPPLWIDQGSSEYLKWIEIKSPNPP